MKQTTVCLLQDNDRVLLGLKKRGFGQGKIVAIGGKIEPDETREQATTREFFEETGVEIPETALQDRGQITFYFPYKPVWNLVVYIYAAREWQGVPIESDEIRPRWFSVENLPFSRMWQDSQYWLKQALQGCSIAGSVTFAADNESPAEINLNY